MAQSRPASPGLLGSLTLLGIPLILQIILLVLLMFLGPRWVRTFDEFGLALPWLARYCVQATHFLAEWWWAVLPFLLLSVLAYTATILLLRHRFHQAWIASLIGLLITMILILLNLGYVVGMGLPLLKLAEGLSK